MCRRRPGLDDCVVKVYKRTSNGTNGGCEPDISAFAVSPIRTVRIAINGLPCAVRLDPIGLENPAWIGSFCYVAMRSRFSDELGTERHDLRRLENSRVPWEEAMLVGFLLSSIKSRAPAASIASAIASASPSEFHL